MDPGPGVVREQGPVPVIQGHVALVHAVDGADEGGDDDEDPDDGEDPEEDDHGTERLKPDPEAWPLVAPFSAVSRLLMLKEFMLLELFMYPESLCLAGLWVTWMLSMMEMETRISPCHKMEEKRAWF